MTDTGFVERLGDCADRLQFALQDNRERDALHEMGYGIVYLLRAEADRRAANQPSA